MSNHGVGNSASSARSLGLNTSAVVPRRPLLRRAYTASTGRELYSAVGGSGGTTAKEDNMGKASPLGSGGGGGSYVLSPKLKANALMRNDGDRITYPTRRRDPALRERNIGAEQVNGEPQTDSNSSSRVLTSSVREIVYKILSSSLENMDYNHIVCGDKCRSISQMIEDSVKRLYEVQYKITALVFVGAIRDEGFDISSQCVWNPSTDSFAMATYKNASLFACGIVFATICDDF